jgi:hypothetical protein
MPAPVGAEPTAEEPEQLVPDPEPRASFRASSDHQLVTEEQVLEDEVAAAAERRGDDSEQEGDQLEHARRMTDRGDGPREVLPSDTGIQPRATSRMLHCRAAICRQIAAHVREVAFAGDSVHGFSARPARATRSTRVQDWSTAAGHSR